MSAIADCFNDIPAYNCLEPLNASMVPLLFAAEMIVYGEFSDRKADILRRLRGLAIVTRVSIQTINPVEWVRLLS